MKEEVKSVQGLDIVDVCSKTVFLDINRLLYTWAQDLHKIKLATGHWLLLGSSIEFHAVGLGKNSMLVGPWKASQAPVGGTIPKQMQTIPSRFIGFRKKKT